MYKLANQVLDAYDDVEKNILRKVAKINPKINIMSSDEHSGIDSDDFALSVITKKASKLNKFPIDCRDNTWLSNQYFNVTHDKLPDEAQGIAAYNIKTACEKHSITPTPAVIVLAKQANSNVYYEGDHRPQYIAPKETDLSKFAEVQKITDSYTHAQYVMATPSHVKVANEYFEQFNKKMPVEIRHKYACAIQKRAGELGMGDQKGTVQKYASSVYSANVDAHLSSRKSLLEIAEPKYTEALDKLAAMKKDMMPVDFANVLAGFDKRAGLTKYYGSYITNPYESTFATMVNPTAIYKTATVSLTSDGIKKLATDKYDKIKDYFGKEVADSLQKHGSEIFESLPNDAKAIIASIADGNL